MISLAALFEVAYQTATRLEYSDDSILFDYNEVNTTTFLESEYQYSRYRIPNVPSHTYTYVPYKGDRKTLLKLAKTIEVCRNSYYNYSEENSLTYFTRVDVSDDFIILSKSREFLLLDNHLFTSEREVFEGQVTQYQLYQNLRQLKK